jgi:hypothetical protein
MAPLHKTALALAGSFAALTFAFAPATASAHLVPAPCDFVTGGGFVFKDDGLMTNFGVHAGCKNGDFWGEVNVLDHENQFHLKSVQITGYLFDPAFPNSRDFCGWGRINDQSELVQFRIRVTDNGEPGTNDQFGVIIDNHFSSGDRFFRISTRTLGGGSGGGGNIQLHKVNNSTTKNPGFFSDFDETSMCGDLSGPNAPTLTD